MFVIVCCPVVFYDFFIIKLDVLKHIIIFTGQNKFIFVLVIRKNILLCTEF
jgi:hypothetical protein